jgi:tellurite resistance protein
MELRDEFANTVLEAAMRGASGFGTLEPQERAALLKEICDLCYEVADAMMKAR